ncbi:MAG: DMT family transporter [Kiritimatiellae bacterium]|nr:DMT family transporter [Kiritimatiellia bacterium]
MRRGIVCICLSAFGFALMAMFVRMADVVGEPLPAIQKAFFRNLVAVALALPAFLRMRRRDPALRRGGPMSAGDWLALVLRALCGTLGVFTNFYAISVIPLCDAMALNKTAPFFTLLACWVFLGERMRPRQLLCVMGAFLGAMLVVKPGFSGGLTLPSLVGLSSGAFAGFAYALLHRLGRRGVSGTFIVLFFSVFSCLACLPFIAVGSKPMNGAQLAALGGAGAGAALGQFGITWAYRFAEPRQIAVYDYSGLIFVSAFGFMAFGQVPDAWSCLGFATIVSMAVLLYARERAA